MVTASVDYRIGGAPTVTTARHEFLNDYFAYQWIDGVRQAMRGSGDLFIGYSVYSDRQIRRRREKETT